MTFQERSDTAAARHAQVVPSFMVGCIRDKLESRLGDIRPAELVCWERKADLSESLREDLRRAVVKRVRPRAALVWPLTVGVHLAQGWRDVLLPTDRKLVERLAGSGAQPLEGWTLRAVKETMGVPLERVLAILARLEAVYWVPPPSSVLPLHSSPAEQGPAVRVSPELRARAADVLRLAWLSKVRSCDLRFAHPGADDLAAWIAEQMERDFVPASVAGLLSRLATADTMTAEDEAVALAQAAGVHCLPRTGSESAGRWIDIFMQRHISPVGAGRTLIDVGNGYGVTRERIRQICEAFEVVFARFDVATPALDRVLQATARIAPCGVEEANEQLRRFIGPGAGIECLLVWAATLGRQDLPLACHRARTRVRGELVDIAVLERAQAAPWVTAMVRHVSRDCSMFGCTNVLRVAGLLALREGAAPGQDAIETALQEASGFRWLDRQLGWFALGDGSSCSAAHRVQKIMAVAHDTVGADAIAAALASDDMWMYRETPSLGLATPPPHVLRELLRGWPWLKVVQKGRFMPSASFDPANALCESERLAVDVIAAHDGVACRFELKAALMEKLDITEVGVNALLGASPIVERLEHGLYRLRGRRVGDAAIACARVRLRERSGGYSVPLPGATADEFVARVTEGALRNEQYSVPTRFRTRLFGRRLPILSPGGEALGEARVTQSGALAGLNRLFAGLEIGDILRIQVLDEALSVSVCQRDASPAAATTASSTFETPEAPLRSLAAPTDAH